MSLGSVSDPEVWMRIHHFESEGEERSEATGHSRNGQSETSEEWARNEAHGDEANVDSGRYAEPDSEPSLSGEGPDFVPGPFSAIIQRLTREAAQQGERRPEGVVRDPLTYPPIQEDVYPIVLLVLRSSFFSLPLLYFPTPPLGLPSFSLLQFPILSFFISLELYVLACPQ